MARRLNPEEEQLFRAVLLASDSALSETISAPLLQLIQENSEAAVVPPLEIILTSGPGPDGAAPA